MTELKEKVLALPYKPGVYMMRNKAGEVIYVGKAKALKNRVSQYFQSEARHTPKTAAMVSHIASFDIIVTETEFEALVLENAMIKKYRPKYNILLKDDKGYPYIKADIKKEFPEFSVVSKPGKDGNLYFGPYSGRISAKRAIDTINENLKLRTCRRVLPRDAGKERPCLNAHLHRCIAPCTGDISSGEYRKLFFQGVSLLKGNYKAVAEKIEEEMRQAAEEMRFERAAELRDRLRAVNGLGLKQKVVSGSGFDCDALGVAFGARESCVVILHFVDGSLSDKEYVFLEKMSPREQSELLEQFIRQYYERRGGAPGTVLIPEAFEGMEDMEAFLFSISQKKTELRVPRRGDMVRRLDLAAQNASEELLRRETVKQKGMKSVQLFAEACGLPDVPELFEAYDISNLAGSMTVGAMAVFDKGKPLKKRYRKFKIQSISGQDDYRAIQEVLSRRLRHYADGDEGFSPLPSVFLIDGGAGQVSAALEVVREYGLAIPVIGMAKDGRHRTDRLVLADGREIGLSARPALFSFVGRMQEEVHRFAIEFHRAQRRQSVGSVLDRIQGVGPKRRNALLRKFHSLEAIKAADLAQLQEVVPESTAKHIIDYWKQEEL